MGLRREPAFMLFGEGIARFDWRGVYWFFLTYFGAFFIAGILAPVIYFWIQGMETIPGEESVVAYLQSKPISRYVDRVRLLFAAVALVWMIGACGLWGRFGFRWAKSGLRTLLLFILFGAGSLGAVVLMQGFLSGPVPGDSFSPGKVFEVIIASLLGGLLIGWLEEAIFRGMVLRMFYTAMQPSMAVVLSALVFAAVHFKSVPAGIGDPFHWYSGMFVAGYQSVSVFLTVELVDFLNLFLAGIVLNLVFLRTGSLIGCMGLHAGWVLVRNSWTKLVEVPEGDFTQILGSERIVDGYASLIILVCIAITLYLELRRYQEGKQVGLGNLA